MRALRERLAIVSDDESRRDPARHMERLKEISLRLEELEQRLPRAADPQLRHFLERRSYSKALEHLASAPRSNSSGAEQRRHRPNGSWC
jgi:hypothetical protein